MHNGSIIPVPGRDIFVQAWYQGGVSVVDFTDSAKPVEIATSIAAPSMQRIWLRAVTGQPIGTKERSTAQRSFAVSTCRSRTE